METITTTTGRTVRISTTKTGTNFGHLGRISALNGRTIAFTDVYPTTQNALEAARNQAEAL